MKSVVVQQTILSEKLSEKLRKYLLFSISPSETIRESDLAKRFGVSRTPIREALNELEKQGIVVRKKKRGTSLKIMTAQEIADIYNVRSVLEGLAARLFCQFVTPESIQNLLAIEQSYQVALQQNDYETILQSDMFFHETIINFCGNDRLAKLVRDCHLLSEIFKKCNGENPREPGIQKRKIQQSKYPHRSIILAFERKDEKKAETLMRRHIEWTKDILLRNILTRRVE